MRPELFTIMASARPRVLGRPGKPSLTAVLVGEVEAGGAEGVAGGQAYRGQAGEGLVDAEAPEVPAAVEGERPAGDDQALGVVGGVDGYPPGLGGRGVVLDELDDRADARAREGVPPPQVAALGAGRVGDEAGRREDRRGDAAAAGDGGGGLRRRSSLG